MRDLDERQDRQHFPAPQRRSPAHMEAAIMNDGHWSFREWETHTIEKIISVSRDASPDVRDDYLRVQIGLAIQQALRHGRSGLGDDDPVVS